MLRWPVSPWSHAGLSLIAASVFATTVFFYVERSHVVLYAKLYPHDGQVGLGAFMDALEDASGTFVLIFVVAFVIQRLVTAGVIPPQRDRTT
jgi:hypothetical protein